MKPERIEQLLKDADAALGDKRPPEAGTMATAVMHARRRRQHRRMAIRGSVMVLALGCVSVWMLQSKPQPQAPNAIVPQRAPQDLAREIETTELNLRRMIAAERLAQAEARLEELSQVPTPQDVTERAAHALLTQADRLAKTGGLSESAERAYGEVIAHLPETPSAKIARQRIAELQKEG